MKKILSIIMLCLLVQGCSGLREMEAVATINNGKYGIASADKGNVVYRAKTGFSILWKQFTFESEK